MKPVKTYQSQKTQISHIPQISQDPSSSVLQSNLPQPSLERHAVRLGCSAVLLYSSFLTMCFLQGLFFSLSRTAVIIKCMLFLEPNLYLSQWFPKPIHPAQVHEQGDPRGATYCGPTTGLNKVQHVCKEEKQARKS